MAASSPLLWINHDCKKRGEFILSFSPESSRFLDVLKKKHFCFAKLAVEMSLKWIIYAEEGGSGREQQCWGFVVPGFPPLGICGCSIPVLVALGLFCLHPPVGGMWRSSLSWAWWGAVGFVGQGCPKAVVQHSSLCTQKLLVCSPLLSWPFHNSLRFLLQAMEGQETLEVHCPDDSGLPFVLLERKVENCQLLW